MSWLLVAILGYVVVQLGVGLYVARRVRNETDYLLAGRTLGYGLATVSIAATWFGAETCLGAAGQMYSVGLSAGARDPFGYTACLVIAGLLLTAPLWRRRLTTLGDLFRTRFDARVERVGALLMAPTSLLWAAAQIRAFGQVLAASSALDVNLAITVAAAAVVAYTMGGGLLADAVTDVLQGVVLTAGLVVLLVSVVGDGSGVAALVGSIEPARRELFPESVPWVEQLETWAVPICGSLVAQELLSRTLGARSASVARRATLLAAGAYLLVGAIPVVLGLVGPSLVPGIEDPEQLLPRLARQHLPEVGYVLFAGAIVSAILSTVDSALLATSALVTENLVASRWRELTPAARLRVARACVLGGGLVAYGLALSADSVFGLVEEASGFGSAGILVVTLFGLFSRVGRARSALVALGAGLVVWCVGAYWLDWRTPYLASLAAAVLAYLAAAAFPSPTAAPVEAGVG